MEALKELKAKVEIFAKYCEQAEKAKDIAEVDDAKVNGLIAFNELQKQVNRSQVALINAARDRRFTLNQQSFHNVRQAVKAVAQEPASSANELPKAAPKAPKPQEPKAKKTTKKAKK